MLKNVTIMTSCYSPKSLCIGVWRLLCINDHLLMIYYLAVCYNEGILLSLLVIVYYVLVYVV